MSNKTPEYAEALVQSIERLAKAATYLADVIGYKADGKNEAKGNPVKLELVTDTPKDDEPLKVFTLTEIKNAMNQYAKRVGKEKALDLVDDYTNGVSQAIADIPVEMYPKLMKEIS